MKSVTDKPITHIINTHTHGDHVGGNDVFPASVEIVAHENTAAYMAVMENFTQPATRHGLPDRTFKERVTLLSGSDAIDLYHFGPAHTGGDTFIVFRNLRVMHAGDVFLGRQTPPTVDTDNGGSASSYSTTLSRAADGIRDVETVIPGHGAIATWQEFLDYRKFVASLDHHHLVRPQAGKREDPIAPLTRDRRLRPVLTTVARRTSRASSIRMSRNSTGGKYAVSECPVPLTRCTSVRWRAG